LSKVKLLITGPPGCGKTTLIKEFIAETKLRAGGFYTQEIRERRREGFKLITLDGREGVLAHLGIDYGPKVGRYGVNLRDLNSIGVGSLEEALVRADLLVVDEIGKMELLSPQFREVVVKCLNSPKPLLGTIYRGAHPFVERVRTRPEVEILQMRKGEGNKVLEYIRGRFSTKG